MSMLILLGVILFWVALAVLALSSFLRTYKLYNLAAEPIYKSIPLAALASLLGPGILFSHALTPVPLFISLLFHLSDPISKAMGINLASFIVMNVLCVLASLYNRTK